MIEEIKIPESLLRATDGCFQNEVSEANVIEELKVVVRWLDAELEKMIDKGQRHDYMRSESMSEYDRRMGNNQAIASVRRLFAAPEPEYPPEVMRLQTISLGAVRTQAELDFLVRELETAAFKLGQESKAR